MAGTRGAARGLNLEGEEDLLPGVDSRQDPRTPLAQRRSLATPSALDTASASAIASTSAAAASPNPVLASPIPTGPASAVRRRTSLAEPDSPHFVPPSPRAPLVGPTSPRNDASFHLSQARAGLGQVGLGVQDSRRTSIFGGSGAGATAGGSAGRRTSAAAHPPPAPSQSFRNGAGTSGPRSSRAGLDDIPPSAHGSPTDPLMSMTPSDVRRPSFLATAVSTAAATFQPSPRRFFLFFPSRRMQKTARFWLVGAFCLFAFVKLIDLIGFSPAAYRSLMQSVTKSAKLARVGALDQLPPSFTNLMDKLPRPSNWMSPGAAGSGHSPLAMPIQQAQSPFRVELGDVQPDEGVLVEEEQLEASRAQLSAEDQERAKYELVLSPLELEMVQRNRREKLWAPPEEDLWVDIAKPKKGSLHESTVIFLHGMGEKAADSFLPVHLHKRFPNTRWVLPQAPDRVVSAFPNKEVPAWFDIRHFPYDPNDRDYDNLFASVRAINRVIAEERALLIRNLRRRGGGAALGVSSGPKVGEGYATSLGPDGEDGADEHFGTKEEREWASKRIVLAGFSEGAVVTLLAGLTHRERLGGLVAFSAFLPLREDMSRLIIDLDRKDLPVFWGHGWNDPFLLFTDALTSVSLIQPTAVPTFDNPEAVPSSLYLDQPSYRLNLTRFTFKSYKGLEHTFDWDELQDVSSFLEGVLPKGTQRGERIPRGLGLIDQDGREILSEPADGSAQLQPVVQGGEGGEAVQPVAVEAVVGGGMRRKRR
ncbi:hypothetical protein JCM8097_003277 [Rhodosporidiobolus ruineniae]